MKRLIWRLGTTLALAASASVCAADMSPVRAMGLGELGSAAQCEIKQGHGRRARADIDEGLALAVKFHDAGWQVQYLRTRAAMALGQGDVADALGDLQRAMTTAAALEPGVRAQVLHERGDARALAEDFAGAVADYRSSLELATGDEVLSLANLLNLARAGLDSGANAEVAETLDAASVRLARLSSDSALGSQWSALGELYFRLDSTGGQWPHLEKAMAALERGRQLAAQGHDRRGESFALGTMGHIAETAHHDATALEYTRVAILLAQEGQALDDLYQWQWQAARLLERAGAIDQAILAYQQSVASLEAIRPDLARRSARSFQRAVAPVFFGMSDLLLRQEAATKDPAQAVAGLRLVRSTIEKLKVAEIQNYFSNDCVIGNEQAIDLDTVSAESAVLYPIIFDDRVELLVSTGSTIRRYTTKVRRDELTATILEFRRALERRSTNRFRVPGKALYDWMIAPELGDLRKAGVKTLVFVPDGPLRTVPVAAFYDGERFLVEEFATATTLGMTLTSPHPLATEQSQILASGLTRPVEGFSALPAVQAELTAIHEIYPDRSTEYQDEAFVMKGVSDELTRGRFSVVHIATHGHFMADYRQSFLLTYDGHLTMNELESTIGNRRYNNEPIELLMLSACETAAGDDRAALGLAGVALKAGARSAVATLWAINDDATSQLVKRFYEELKRGKVTKAQALRAAQLQLIRDQRYAHPAVWSPFLLLGNWL